MKKEKQIKTHQRRTKGGKTVIVRAHKAKYDAADELKKSLSKKKGAGDELESRKKQTPVETPDLGFTDAEFKAWYHWDQEGDPKNKAALKVEKALIAKMGKRAYNRYFNEMSDNYSARGHLKAYKSLVAEHAETPTPKTPKVKETRRVKKEAEGSSKSTGSSLSVKTKGNFIDMGEGESGIFYEDFTKSQDIATAAEVKRIRKMAHEDLETLKKAGYDAELVWSKYEDWGTGYGYILLKSNKPVSTPKTKTPKKEDASTKSKPHDKTFVEGFLEGKPSTETLNPQPKEKTSWGHTSKQNGKSVRTLDMRGQANYDGIKASGIKLPKKFTYDSDTRSDYYDSFRTKDPTAMTNVINQAKKAKWQKGGSGKMVRYTSPDGRVHILIDRSDKNKSVSIFYR